MKTWISAGLVTAAIAFGGAFASTHATAAPQPSQKATSVKAEAATDISSARRRHHVRRHYMHGAYYHGYAPRYVRPYPRAYYLQPAYSGRPYGYGGYDGYRPSYYGGYGRPYGYDGYRPYGGYGYRGGYGPSIGIGFGFGGPGFGFGGW